MSTKTSPLTDKLPPEIRIRIYKEALRSDQPLLLVSDEYPEEVRFDVSLLAVSKSIHAEAIDCFYEVNTIRLWQRTELDVIAARDSRRCSQLVRHLELVNLRDEDQWLHPETSNGLKGVVDTCLAFPKIKSLTIAYDPLRSKLLPYVEKTLNKSSAIRCNNVGLFELLVGNRTAMIYFKHYGMVKTWEEVKSTTGPINLRQEMRQYNRKHNGYDVDRVSHHQVPIFISHAKLPLWCELYDIWRPAKLRGDVFPNYAAIGASFVYGDLSLAIAAHFEKQFLPFEAGQMPRMCPGLGGEVCLRELDAGKHGREVLQWLSELLQECRQGLPSIAFE